MSGPYALDVTAWKADHAGWILAPGLGSVLWRARPRGGGPWVLAGSLDDLADRVAERKDETHE